MEIRDARLAEIISSDGAGELLANAEPFFELMMKYGCAIREVRTKFEVLSDEFEVRYNRNPVESIKTRIKKPSSIIEKLRRRGLPVTVDSIRQNLSDIAGIRIICSYIDDIYALVDMFAKQDDVVILEVKDYIQTPKDNGYRSLHLIIEIPIFLSDRKEIMRAEVQIRTIAMDFWASLEHELKYKQNLKNENEIVEELRICSENIASMDLRMQDIRKKIDGR